MKKELQQLNDAQLVHEYRNGNSPAWEALFNRYQPNMLRYVASIAGNDLAHDVMQDTWVVVITSILNGSYKEEQRFSKWIKTIAYKQAVEAWREEHKFGYKEEVIPETIDDAGSADANMIGKEEETTLFKALQRLSRRESMVVYMHAMEEMSFEQICLYMNLKRASHVRTIYCRALSKMRQLIHAKDIL